VERIDVWVLVFTSLNEYGFVTAAQSWGWS